MTLTGGTRNVVHGLVPVYLCGGWRAVTCARMEVGHGGVVWRRTGEGEYLRAVVGEAVSAAGV